MKLLQSVCFMILGSFIFQYYVMSYIMTNNTSNITNSLGKIYNSSIMSIFMGILEVFMNDIAMKTIHWNYYLPLFLLFIILFASYKWQIGISDNEYLKEMIEHHSMALLTSEEILQKTSNYKVRKVAHNIVNNQESEIKYMKKLLKETNPQLSM